MNFVILRKRLALKLVGSHSQNEQAPPYSTNLATMRQTNPRMYAWWRIGAENETGDNSSKGERGEKK